MEGTWLWKLSPLCPLSRTITQGPPPAPGVISWRAPERRALTSPLSPSGLRICPPPTCQPVTERKQRPHLGLLPPPGWLELGAQGTWGALASGTLLGAWAPKILTRLPGAGWTSVISPARKMRDNEERGRGGPIFSVP